MNNLLKTVIAPALVCALSAIATAAPQPIDHFARRPQMHGVTMSADGRYIAFLSGSGDETVLMTFDRTQAGSAFKRVAASEPGKFDLAWCRFANEKRLLCGLYGNIRGKQYAEQPFKRLFAVDVDGTALKTLEQSRDEGNLLVSTTSARNFNMNLGAELSNSNQSSFALWQEGAATATFGEAARASATYRPERQDEVIDLTPDDDDTVLIQLDDDRDSFRTLFQLNIYTGLRSVRLNENPPIRNFVTDSRGNPRIGWGTENLKTFYFARLDGDKDWRPLVTIKTLSADNELRPIAMAAGANSAYAIGVSEGREALWSIDLADKAEPQLLFKHPLVDVGEPLFSTDRRLLGVRYDVERPYVWYADPKQRELIDRLEKQFPNRVFDIVDSSDDKKTLLLQSSNDVDLGTYYIYDAANDKLQKLGSAYPELDQKTLGTMTYITYKAADGAEIPAYLTVPSGAERKNLPLIVMPHDGPSTRDSWKFSYLRTFLANRGYAVLQMNYRGSAGFGLKWLLDARQDWGGLTYSDIHDATRWAISEGIADPKRICIMGSGFGGYAALLGAARNGDTYRCAISIAGITDLKSYQDQGAISGDENIRRALIGDDKEKAKRNSPVELASKINIPVMLVHGTKDWQVQIDQTNAMTRALEKAKKPYEEVIIKNAGHDLERKSDRATLLKEVETFLNTHLGPGAAS